MIIINDLECLKEKSGLAATTGFFDGVHLGHRYMLGELRRIAAERGLSSAVITFPTHPRRVLQADFQPALLNSFDEKLERLAETGVDYCIVFDFTLEFARLKAEDYIIDRLARQCGVKTLLTGYDHRFGHNRTAGPEEYRRYAASCGMELIEADRYRVNNEPLSSSSIRKLLCKGFVEEAAQRLTYAFRMEGIVVEGHRIGRTLGFPTMNVSPSEPHKLVPAPGVYAAQVLLDGCIYKGMLYIGTRPTFSPGSLIVPEVHLLGYDGDAYGKKISITLEHRVRGDIRFQSKDELIVQLELDRQEVLKLLDDGK